MGHATARLVRAPVRPADMPNSIILVRLVHVRPNTAVLSHWIVSIAEEDLSIVRAWHRDDRVAVVRPRDRVGGIGRIA